MIMSRLSPAGYAVLAILVGFSLPLSALETFPYHRATEKKAGSATVSIETCGGLIPDRGICALLGNPRIEAAITLARETNLIVYVQLANGDAARQQRYMKAWGKLSVPGAEPPLWQSDCPGSVAVATCENAVVVALQDSLTALNLKNGEVLWSLPLPARPVEWGLAVNAQRKIIVSLEDGKILCFGPVDG